MREPLRETTQGQAAHVYPPDVLFTQPPLGAQSKVLDLLQTVAQHPCPYHVHCDCVRPADEDIHRYQALF